MNKTDIRPAALRNRARSEESGVGSITIARIERRPGPGLGMRGRRTARKLRSLSEIAPRRIVDDDRLPVSESLYRMTHVFRDNRNDAGPHEMSDAVDRHFEFALDYFVDFLLPMEMLVNR